MDTGINSIVPPGGVKPQEILTDWNPSSTWDYITVDVDTQNKPHHCTSWCNPLMINFTPQGNAKDWTKEPRGLSWGLCLYLSGYDQGLYFTIKLLKAVPSTYRASIGPNPVLHNFVPSLPKKGSEPKNPVATQAPQDSLVGTVSQPTIPPGPMPSSRVILSILNASASALLLQEQMNNSSKYVECWMCFSASPPFYEGIALFGEFIYSNESNVLYGGSLGFTLTEVSGVGSCILGEHMLPPHQLLEICNHTLVVNKHHEYLLAPNHTYLACSSGLNTYVIISDFLQQRDYYVLVQLLPRLSIHEPQDILDFWDRNPGAAHREKREPISAITLAVLLGLGTAGTGKGIASLVTSQQNQQRYHLLSAAIDQDLAELREGLANLKDSVASLSEVVLQNRRELDLLFLQQGGLCAALKENAVFM